MKTKKVDISQCKQGDILAEDIYNQNGTLMIAENTVINSRIIQKLIELELANVLIIRADDVDDEKSPFDEFKQTYIEKTHSIKEILDGFVSGEDLYSEKVDELSDSLYEQAIESYKLIEYISQMKSKDEYTYTHSINVSIYAMMLSRWLGLSEKETKDIIKAGVLHDMGKLKLSDSIINKKTEDLSKIELIALKKHPAYGYEIARSIPDLDEKVRQGILMHHERQDGSGYPMGLTGDKINIYAKILSVADTYDKLIMQKDGTVRTPFEAFDEIEKVGFGYFDPKVITIFMKNISNCYVGARIKLNTGEMGKIIAILPQNISEPIICINNKLIDLSSNKSLKIAEVLSI
jgi:putative nucleotidyltransferase with HDIG domain